MKGSRLYLIVLFAFLMIVFLFEYMSPHKFVWTPTYDKNDKEPFGSYVFDDVLSSSIEDYSVTNKTLYQILQEDSTISQHAFLLTEERLTFSEVDIESLYKLIHLGNQVMICTRDFPYSLEDTLCFEVEYKNYYPPLNVYIQEQRNRDSIFFGVDTLNPEYIFEIYPYFHPVSITTGKSKWIKTIDDETTPDNKNFIDDDKAIEDNMVIENEEDLNNETNIRDEMDTDYEINEDTIIKTVNTETGKRQFVPINCDSMKVLVWNNKNEPLVIHTFLGKGELFLVTTPLMFTNYGILDGNNASYAFRLLSYMKDKPLFRIEAYGKHGDKPQTPLRYVLSEPPLRWALYSTIILLISFMAFASRRRQRIIPVVNAPPNRSLEFMQLISNLYYQKHNNGEILKMKHTYFCAEVKSLIGIDIQENATNEQEYKRLTEKTGLEFDYIRGLLKNIQMALFKPEVDDIQLKQYIDGMSHLLKVLKS